MKGRDLQSLLLVLMLTPLPPFLPPSLDGNPQAPLSRRHGKAEGGGGREGGTTPAAAEEGGGGGRDEGRDGFSVG